MGYVYDAGGADTNTASTTDPMAQLNQKTTVLGRLAISQLRICSVGATPGGDYQSVYRLQRITGENASPTGTQITPTARDPAAPATASRVRENPNAPVQTANAFVISYLGGNIRSQIVWVPRDEKAKIIIPATIENGICLLCFETAAAYAIRSDWEFEEGY